MHETERIVFEKFVAKIGVKNAKSGQLQFVTKMFVRMNERNVERWHVLFY